jgi:disulfide bond formation protein DsbB
MTPRQLLYIRLAFLVALAATLGSLYFSELAGFPPCKLCWLQRIAIYPLMAVFAVGLIRRDSLVHLYAWPFIIFGLLVAAYHNLLYYKIIADTLASCELGISCTTKYIEWFGFITIPMLSLLTLATFAVLMLAFKKEGMSTTK